MVKRTEEEEADMDPWDLACVSGEELEKRIEPLYEVPGNGQCCECNEEKPQWAVMHLGILVCANCAKGHQALPEHVPHVFELNDNESSWPSEWLEYLKQVGNDAVNEILEWHEETKKHKPSPESSPDKFIKEKYVQKLFMKELSKIQSRMLGINLLQAACKDAPAKDLICPILKGFDTSSTAAIDALYECAKKGNSSTSLALLFNGTNIGLSLHAAASLGDYSLACSLLRHMDSPLGQKQGGAKILLQQNGKGQTALEVAAAAGHEAVAELLGASEAVHQLPMEERVKRAKRRSKRRQKRGNKGGMVRRSTFLRKKDSQGEEAREQDDSDEEDETSKCTQFLPSTAAAKSGWLLKRSKGRRNVWRKRYCVLVDGVLSLYHNEEEVENKVKPTFALPALTANVKPISDKKPFSFQMITIDRNFIMAAATQRDCDEWMMVLANATMEALGSNQSKLSSANDDEKTVLEKERVYATALAPWIADIRAVEGNDVCCDCHIERPEWASINLGILMCIECSGHHRSLGTHISKVRSFRLDDWDVEVLEMFKMTGNKALNEILEADLMAVMQLKPSASNECDRESFIRKKYIERSFVLNKRSSEEKHAELERVAAMSDTSPVDVMTVILQGARPEFDGSSALLGAVRAGNPLVTLLLLLNGADVNAGDGSEGGTALHIAGKLDKLDVAKVLLKNGAKLWKLDSHGNSPLKIAEGSVVELYKPLETRLEHQPPSRLTMMLPNGEDLGALIGLPSDSDDDDALAVTGPNARVKAGWVQKKSQTLMGKWYRRWATMEGGVFRLYHDEEDLIPRATCAAVDIQATALKLRGTPAFQLTTRTKKIILRGVSAADSAEWLLVLANAAGHANAKKEDMATPPEEESVVSGSSLTMALENICGIPGNGVCADCGVADPTWASSNLGVLICDVCAAIHQELPDKVSSVQPLTSTWNEDVLAYLKATGNKAVNSVFESDLMRTRAMKPEPNDDDSDKRETFIRKKYEFALMLEDPRDNDPDVAVLSERLYHSVSGGSPPAAVLVQVVRGADPNHACEGLGGDTALHAAARLGDIPLTLTLLLNGAVLSVGEGSAVGTPLHAAAALDEADVLQILAKRGGDVFLTDAEGRTPLDVALLEGATNCAPLLEAMGCVTRVVENAIACPLCGSDVDPNWKICPHCQSLLDFDITEAVGAELDDIFNGYDTPDWAQLCSCGAVADRSCLDCVIYYCRLCGGKHEEDLSHRLREISQDHPSAFLDEGDDAPSVFIAPPPSLDMDNPNDMDAATLIVRRPTISPASKIPRQKPPPPAGKPKPKPTVGPKPAPAPAPPPDTEPAALCEECEEGEENRAVLRCEDCAMNFCEDCSTSFHVKRRKGHAVAALS